jgi:DNA-binding transcriptional regulator YbjK
MARTAAERQAAARARRRCQAVGAEAGERAHQLNIFIRAKAMGALQRLARRWRVSQRQALEALLIEAEERVVKVLTDAELTAYLAPTERD